jgi:tripartite-type tricarboxylate transporter receptor subunit TctC
MTGRTTRVAVAICTTLALASFAHAANAQDFPSKPITWVVGFPPGGVSDQGARYMARQFAEKLGQPVVVENKPGAGGIIAAEHVAAAKPDGYTIMYGASGPLASFVSLYKKLSYDPIKSFTLIQGYVQSPLLLAVPANSPFKTLRDLVEFGKQNPGKLNFGSVGSGSGAHLAAELLGFNAGISMTHVPYKGSAQAITEMLGGNLDLIFDYSIVLKPQIDAGKLRALAVTAPSRLVSHPGVPTTAELGYPGVQLTAWATIVGPAGIPQPVVDLMAKAFNETLKDPAVVKFHNDLGMTLMPDVAGSKLHAFVVEEQAKWKDVIVRTGASAD